MKYFFYLASFLLLGCNNNDDLENQTTNPSQAKIQTLTIQDEEIQNGNASIYEKLDFKFEYNNQGKLIKVWDIHNNYTENLIYNGNLISDITITGFQYPQLSNQIPLYKKRHLTYDTSQRLIKSEALENPNNNSYVTLGYPASNLIIVKKYSKNYLGNMVNTDRLNIYLTDQNVTKIEQWYDAANMSILLNITKYEYDQKINPNFMINLNRILALPDYSFNVFELQDYSQISKNNVIKKQKYAVNNGIEELKETVNINYNYQSNDLPGTIYLQYNYPDNNGLKVSAIYGY
jgi:hypothetical protein